MLRKIKIALSTRTKISIYRADVLLACSLQTFEVEPSIEIVDFHRGSKISMNLGKILGITSLCTNSRF